MSRAGEAEPATSTTYTLRRVEALLGLSRRVIAGLIAEGFVKPTRGPRNAWRFTFQDLALLRTAFALQSSGIPPRRILRSLAQLKATLPAELPLTGLRITAIGPDVAVRARDGRWQAGSGQLLIDFDVAPVAGSVALIERGDDAAEWFERGRALEARDSAGAEAAYRKAIALDAAHEAAHLHLGALLSEAGRYAEMALLCDEALTQVPRSALLHYNRAVALDHLERLDEALQSYESALALDPALADAHYNLARLAEQRGDERGALRHFAAYRRLERG